MIRMRSTHEAPPHGWIVYPPLVSKPLRDWSFEALCRQVERERPEWTPEQIRSQVNRANAERMLGLPDGARWVIMDSAPEPIPDLLAQAGDRTAALSAGKGLLLVLPFCSREVQLLVKLLDWMVELGPETKPDILISYDRGVPQALAREVKVQVLRLCNLWAELIYPVPPAGYFAPNWAFQCTANFIAGTMARPWFWFETDMVPLKPEWFSALQAAYLKGGKPCMGVIVPQMGHMNGTAIYPADFATWAKRAMAAHTSAWDMEQAQDIAGRVHEASYLMQHVWGMVGGQPHPSQGIAASFPSQSSLHWIKPNAVVLHRCKDGSLIDRLRERKS